MEDYEDSEKLYRVNASVEGCDDNPSDNEFDYIEDAEALMEQIVREYQEDNVKDWDVAVYDTFECQNVRHMASADDGE